MLGPRDDVPLTVTVNVVRDGRDDRTARRSVER